MISDAIEHAAPARVRLATAAIIVASCCAAPLLAVDRFQFSPSKIKPNDSYKILIDLPNGTMLDYDRRQCGIDFEVLSTDSGGYASYTVQNGEITIPGGQNIPPGVHMIRFKPRGAPASEYTKFDVLLVDALDTIDNGVTLTSQTISLPTPGSYVLFENWKDGQFLGYSRFDYETDACETGGFTMRMTKTHESCYWNAGGPSFLRWCVDHADTPQGRYLVATGGTLYQSHAHGSLANLAASAINVTYEGNGWSQSGSQGLLGGWPVGEVDVLDEYLFDPDMRVHYSLLPVDDKVPANLSNTPATLVELAYGHWSADGKNDTFLDTWHDEVMAPTMPDSVLRMRYIETGAILHDTWIQDRWSVTEDWDWQLDGLVTRVVHWVWNDPPCWRNGYDCESNATLAVDAIMVDSYVPDGQPLTLGFKCPATGQIRDRVHILQGEPYTVVVTRADSQPYSGFLELQVGGASAGPWRDLEWKPIYVSRGMVTIGPAAYGTPQPSKLVFSARPYLANSSLNALAPALNGTLVPNASTAAYSNDVTFVLSLVRSDFDGDKDVDPDDFGYFQSCMSGPGMPLTNPSCCDADYDGDGDVDLTDFGRFQRCLSGATVPADLACDD